MSPGAQMINGWLEDFPVVLAADGESVLVFSEWFQSENEAGEVEFDEDDRAVWEDKRHLRLYDNAKIHQHLQEAGEGTPGSRRIVRFLGANKAAYRLERLTPGPTLLADELDAGESDAFCALCQHWAMQYLSACRLIHPRGVVIASSPQHVIWLRSDYSLAVANFAAASCRELRIEALQQGGDEYHHLCPYGQPWDSWSGNDDLPVPVEACGQPRLDLFMWATWVHDLLTPGEEGFLGFWSPSIPT